MSKVEYFDDERGDVIYLDHRPGDTYTILDIPSRRGTVIPALAEVLRQHRYSLFLLTGADKPEGIAYPFGVRPHPDPETLAELSAVVEMPVQPHEIEMQAKVESSH